MPKKKKQKQFGMKIIKKGVYIKIQMSVSVTNISERNRRE